ncbi:MAG: tetratricopeptide repeat protein [Euryarchaeota archaeon]|nr:tetratricopeptide repeat protein [Euryarchaeota archaeon]
MEEIATADVEEIDTIITELEISKGKGNLILCVVNSPAYRDRIIQVLEGRFSSEVVHVEKGEQIIQTLRNKRPDGQDILVWIMPEKLTEDLADTLNNFRELFYAAGVPSLIFLSQSFLTNVIREAPDFWRYRGNYYELEGEVGGFAFHALETLATPLHYQDEADLLRRKRINEYLLEKVTDKMEKVKVLDELGAIYYNLGEYHEASKYVERALKLSESLGDKSDVARSRLNLGILTQDTGDLDEARRLYEDSLKTFQELDDKSGVANTLLNLGILAQDTGDLGEARRLYEESLKTFQELGDKSDVANTQLNLGNLAQVTGDLDEARRLYEDSLKTFQELGDKSNVANTLHNQGILAWATGDLDEARRLYEDSLETFQELGYKSNVANSLAMMALLEETEGDLERALDLIQQAETLFIELGSSAAAHARKDRERLEKSIQSG